MKVKALIPLVSQEAHGGYVNSYEDQLKDQINNLKKKNQQVRS